MQILDLQKKGIIPLDLKRLDVLVTPQFGYWDGEFGRWDPLASNLFISYVPKKVSFLDANRNDNGQYNVSKGKIVDGRGLGTIRTRLPKTAINKKGHEIEVKTAVGQILLVKLDRVNRKPAVDYYYDYSKNELEIFAPDESLLYLDDFPKGFLSYKILFGIEGRRDFTYLPNENWSGLVVRRNGYGYISTNIDAYRSPNKRLVVLIDGSFISLDGESGEEPTVKVSLADPAKSVWEFGVESARLDSEFFSEIGEEIAAAQKIERERRNGLGTESK